MPFLLGSFTDGLFSGASDVFTLYQNYQQIQAQRERNKAADEYLAKRAALGNTDNSMPKVNTLGPANTTPTPTSTGAFADDPELKNVVQPQAKTATGTRIDRPGQNSPREGKAFGGSAPAAPAAPKTTPTGSDYIEAIPGIEGGAGGYTPPPPAKPLAPGVAGPAGSTWALPPPIPPAPSAPSAATPQRRTEAPTYLPPGATAQAAPPALPNLASSQMGLGAQMLAALNPTAGRTV